MTFVSTLSHILSRVAVLQVLWRKWDIRTFIIASFSFQLILILSAPFRKRTSNLVTRAYLWASYLLADWVAAQAIGLIIKATEPGCQSVSDSQGYLFAFWAQFLLIHLGGPDTITALALEDNELWLRTALHLGAQAYGSLGVLFRSTQRSGLWVATVLMFLVGTIKYLERVVSLSHGRLDSFDENPDEYLTPDMRRYAEPGWTDREDQSRKRLTNVEIVKDAFNFFHFHKRFFADRQVSPTIRKITHEYFMRRTPEEAYKLLEIQLNFVYEALYTKMEVIHKTVWKILRHVVFLLEVVGLVFWCLVDKRSYQEYDIRITNTLVVGVIAVDLITFLRLNLSDWSIARVDEKGCWADRRIKLYNKILASRTRSWKEEEFVGLWSLLRRRFLGRWSESIHKLSFENQDDKLGKMANAKKVIGECPCLVRFAFRWIMMKKEWVSSEMWEFIFEVLRNRRSEEAKKYKLVESGEEVDIDSLVERALPTDYLKEYYSEVIFHWSEFTEFNVAHEDENLRNEGKIHIAKLADISMTLMGYLVYLIYFKPNMMFGAAGKEKILIIIDPLLGRQNPSILHGNDLDSLLERVQVGDYNTEDQGQGRVVNLSDLNRLLDKIEYVDEDEREIVKWELIARVWVKMICYAAAKCRPNEHAEQLKQGGELLSFVCLLMLHLGKTPL